MVDVLEHGITDFGWMLYYLMQWIVTDFFSITVTIYDGEFTVGSIIAWFICAFCFIGCVRMLLDLVFEVQFDE